jgi:outer membrane receptor protein involved in Fe transport
MIDGALCHRRRNRALTGRVALSYELPGGTLLYASYNRGYRSGAFNGGGYTSSAGSPISRRSGSTPMKWASRAATAAS